MTQNQHTTCSEKESAGSGAAVDPSHLLPPPPFAVIFGSVQPERQTEANSEEHLLARGTWFCSRAGNTAQQPQDRGCRCVLSSVCGRAGPRHRTEKISNRDTWGHGILQFLGVDIPEIRTSVRLRVLPPPGGAWVRAEIFLRAGASGWVVRPVRGWLHLLLAGLFRKTLLLGDELFLGEDAVSLKSS